MKRHTRRNRKASALSAMIMLLAVLVLSANVIWHLFEHDDFSFQTDLEGQVFTVEYETYYRTEPRKDSSKNGYLACGDTVVTTGGVNDRWCPSTTCPCGGKEVWWQVISSGETYWIQAEAVGQ